MLGCFQAPEDTFANVTAQHQDSITAQGGDRVTAQHQDDITAACLSEFNSLWLKSEERLLQVRPDPGALATDSG